MKLSDVELIPGEIFNVEDPMKIGRVKAEAPGMWNRETMRDQSIPWLWPLYMDGNQKFSKMFPHRKIWVIKTKDTYKEYYYLPLPEIYPSTSQILEEYDNPEILISRDIGTESVQIYYNDKDGIMIKHGDKNQINIHPQNGLTVKYGEGKVYINGNHVYLGDGEEGEPAVMGNQLKEMLKAVAQGLNQAAGACVNYPVAGLQPGLLNASFAINNALPKLLADNTSVD